MLRIMRTALATAILVVGTTAISTAAEFDMRFGSYAPEGDVIDRAINVFMDEVHANSDGRIEITLFRNNTLGSNREVSEMAKAGSVDLFVSGATHVSRLAPILIATSFPYMFKDVEDMFQIVDGEHGQQIVDNVAKHGLQILGFWTLGVRSVSNNVKPIVNPEDIVGLKIRTLPSPVHIAFFKKVGAIPTPMDWAEVMPALQQNVIDGQENAPAVMYPYKVYEFQKYYSLTGHSAEPTILVMSKVTWDRLPPDLQAVVRDAAAKATELERQLAEEYNRDIMGKLSEVIEINEVPEATRAAFRDAAVSVYEVGYEALDDEGRAIIDAIVKADN